MIQTRRIMTTQKIEITPRTIIFTVLFLLSLWFLYQIRGIVILLFIAFILMTAVNPLVRLATKIKLPIIVVMLVVYVGLITLLTTVIASLVPAVVQQTRGLAQMLPNYLHNLENIFNTEFDPGIANGYLTSIPSNILKLATGVFGNILNILAHFRNNFIRDDGYLLDFFSFHGILIGCQH